MSVISTAATVIEGQVGTMSMQAYDGFGSCLEVTFHFNSNHVLVRERHGAFGPWYEALMFPTNWVPGVTDPRIVTAVRRWLARHGEHASMQSLSWKRLDCFNEVLNLIEFGESLA